MSLAPILRFSPPFRFSVHTAPSALRPLFAPLCPFSTLDFPFCRFGLTPLESTLAKVYQNKPLQPGLYTSRKRRGTIPAMCRKCKILYRLNRRRFHQILVAMRARLASMWNMHIPHEKLRRFFGWEILSFGCLSGVGMGLVTFHRFSDAIVLFSVACVVVGIQVLFRIFAIQDWWPWKVIAIALTFIGVSFCDSYLTRVAIEQEGEYYAALIEKLARVPSRLPAAKPSTNDTAANTSPPVTKKQPRPLIKQDAFSTLIPFITEESSGMLIRARIPLDSNDNDPLRLTYSEIASIGDILLMPEVDPQSGVVKAPTLTDVDMRNFLGRVLQYYTLLAIGKMQHTCSAPR